MRRRFKSVLVLLVGVLLLSVPGIVEASEKKGAPAGNGKYHWGFTAGHESTKVDYDWWRDKETREFLTKEEAANSSDKNNLLNYVGWFTHDKQIVPTATTCWFTKGFVATLNEVNKVSEGALNPDGKRLELWYPNYKDYISNPNADTEGFVKWTKRDCPAEFNYLDTAFLFDTKKIAIWGFKTGATFTSEGKMTFYLQPIIGIKERSSSTSPEWKITGEEYRTLTGWENARGWSDSSSFKDHYNKELSLQVPSDVDVSYQTIGGQNILLTNGTDPDKKYEKIYAGSTLKYTSTGMVERFSGVEDTNNNGKIDEGEVSSTWILAGVKVNRDPNNEGYVVGTYGTLKTNCESGSIAILDKLYSPATATINDIPDTATAKAKWKITTNGKSYKSDFYTFMKDRKFQCTLDTQITYYYVRVPEKVKTFSCTKIKNFSRLRCFY